MLYLTGVHRAAAAERASSFGDVGLLGTPAGGTWRKRELYGTWAADNGCFAELTRPGAFDPAKWLAWLELAGAERCLWATLPDVVGDPIGTWERSVPFIDPVRALGFPVALVLQDGLEHEPAMWAEMLAVADAVFVGGSDEWKDGAGAAELVAAAHAAGKWVHVGRVNTWRRWSHVALNLGADSADGTMLRFGAECERRMIRWLNRVNVTPAATAA